MKTNLNSIKDPTKVNKLIHKAYQLNYICSKNNLIQLANELLSKNLQAPLQQHCQISNIAAITATVSVDNAVWVNQLRYQEKQVLGILRQDPKLKFINSLKIRVQPPEAPPKRHPPRKMAPMSSKTRELVADTAKSVKNDALKQALLRLAKDGSSSSI